MLVPAFSAWLEAGEVPCSAPLATAGSLPLLPGCASGPIDDALMAGSKAGPKAGFVREGISPAPGPTEPVRVSVRAAAPFLVEKTCGLEPDALTKNLAFALQSVEEDVRTGAGTRTGCAGITMGTDGCAAVLCAEFVECVSFFASLRSCPVRVALPGSDAPFFNVLATGWPDACNEAVPGSTAARAIALRGAIAFADVATPSGCRCGTVSRGRPTRFIGVPATFMVPCACPETSRAGPGFAVFSAHASGMPGATRMDRKLEPKLRSLADDMAAFNPAPWLRPFGAPVAVPDAEASSADASLITAEPVMR